MTRTRGHALARTKRACYYTGPDGRHDEGPGDLPAWRRRHADSRAAGAVCGRYHRHIDPTRSRRTMSRAASRPRGPQALGACGSFATLAGKATALDALDRALRQTLPMPLRDEVRFANLRGGRLLFLASTPAWATRLRLLQAQILATARGRDPSARCGCGHGRSRVAGAVRQAGRADQTQRTLTLNRQRLCDCPDRLDQTGRHPWLHIQKSRRIVGCGGFLFLAR